MTRSQLPSLSFEGHALTILEVDGRSAWIAREVGAALGYADDGKGFVASITRHWSDELLEGSDYRVLRGEGPHGCALHTSDRGQGSLLVLFESGLHLALIKTGKPAGRRLRRLLAEQVLPHVARTGRYELAAALRRLLER